MAGSAGWSEPLLELAQDALAAPDAAADLAAADTTAAGTAVADTAAAATNSLTGACGADPDTVCRWVFDQTDNSFLAITAEWVVEKPFTVLVIFIAAVVISRLLKRAIIRLSERITQATATAADAANEHLTGRTLGRYVAQEEERANRAQIRSKTLSNVLSSIASFTVWILAGLIMLSELGLNVGPLIAGAGIAGVALGFGAQTVVRDFLSGMFMLLEDQFGVGDIIDLADLIDVSETFGTVERLSLRVTTVRDASGTVWHIPNGEIKRIGNRSQLWSRALLDVEVAYQTDLRLAEGVVQRVANEMWHEPRWGDRELLEEPEVWGIENLGESGIAIRLVIKTEPGKQGLVQRELRLRIKEAFDEAGIEIPFPQRTVWIRREGDFRPGEKPSPETIRTVEPPRYRLGKAKVREGG